MTDRPPGSESGTSDGRLFAPAAQRNQQPILDVLSRVLPARGLVLEIASGSGEHALYFARHLPSVQWQPSDPDPASRRSIDAHAAAEACPNARPALDLDAAAAEWPLPAADAVVCINMVHIAPWAAIEGLFAGAARLLAPAGVLYLYGPYKRDGHHTAPSNEAFDASLRRRNSTWGVRNLEDVAALGARTGFTLAEVVDMPANNHSLVFFKK
jgi:SAM-dependent methyltransferase